MSFFNRLALALSYVTCIPVGAKFVGDEETMLDGLSKYLPLVGLLIGAVLAALATALNRIHADAFFSSALSISAWLWLTGGLHMDGLMDTADGIFSHRSKERMLEIMQDSRVGNFAVLVAITVIGLKIFALHSLSSTTGLIALALIPGWARACEVYAIGRFEYARPFGKGKVWHDTTVFPRDLLIGSIPVTALTAAIACFHLREAGIITMATIASGILSAHFLNRKISGHTGDTYGAVVEIAELAGISIAALLLQ